MHIHYSSSVFTFLSHQWYELTQCVLHYIRILSISQENEEGFFDLSDVMSYQVEFLEAIYHSLQKAIILHR